MRVTRCCHVSGGSVVLRSLACIWQVAYFEMQVILGSSPESLEMNQGQKTGHLGCLGSFVELLGDTHLSFILCSPLLDYCPSHCSVKWLWDDLIGQEIIKAFIRVETERGRQIPEKGKLVDNP